MFPSVRSLSLRQRIGVGAVAVAPLLAVIGSGLQPADSNNAATEVARFAAHRDRYFVGYLLMALGLWLFVPASTALVRLFRDRGSRAGTVSCMVMAVGAVFLGAATLMVAVVERVITGGNITHAAAVSVVHAADHSNAAGLPWMIGMLTFLGFIAVGVSLLYARTVPWWQPALLIVGAVCVFISGSGPSSVWLGLPILVAFGSLAWSLTRMPTPAPVTTDVSQHVPSQSAPVDAAERADA